MKSSPLETDKGHILDIAWTDRWQIYQRLQELDIICVCETNQPLIVEVNNPTAAIQLWSVVHISSWRQRVPVGLLGLAMKISRVRGVMAAAMASRSCLKPGSGISTVVAPKRVAMSL